MCNGREITIIIYETNVVPEWRAFRKLPSTADLVETHLWEEGIGDRWDLPFITNWVFTDIHSIMQSENSQLF